MDTTGWQRNLAAVWTAQALTIVAFSFVFPFIPLYVQTLGVSGATEAVQWAGLINAASAVSMSIVQPIWGSLSDRWGKRPMIIRSMVGGSITVILMGVVQTPLQLLIVRLVQGAIAGSVAASTALVATGTPKEKLGFALGIMQVAMFFGMSIGPLLGGVIADTFGYRAPFYVAGALCMLGVAIVVKFVRENFTRPTAETPTTGIWAGSRILFAMALFPILVGVIFMIQFGGVIISPVLAIFVADLSGNDNAATIAGVVLGATGAVSAASALAIGRVSDRVGHMVILPICLAGAAIAYLPQAFVRDVWQLLTLRMLLGVFLGGLMPSANALVARTVPQERRGAAFGLTSMASSSANAVGPLLAAFITTHWGVRAVFLATTGLFGLAYAVVAVGFRRGRASQSERGGVPAVPNNG